MAIHNEGVEIPTPIDARPNSSSTARILFADMLAPKNFIPVVD